jgi:hypothetical protein
MYCLLLQVVLFVVVFFVCDFFNIIALQQVPFFTENNRGLKAR